jgi:hypothetical protein
MAAETRTIEAVSGKEKLVWVKKPSGSTFIEIGCLTNYDYTNPGAEAEELACRKKTAQAPSGDKKLFSLNIEGIEHVYDSTNAALNVSASEVEGWVDSEPTQIVTVMFGGSKAGDKQRTARGWFSNYQEKNPQKGFATYSVTFNPIEKYTTTTLS